MKPFFKQYENGLRLVFKRVEPNRPASLFIAVDVGSCKEDDSKQSPRTFLAKTVLPAPIKVIFIIINLLAKKYLHRL